MQKISYGIGLICIIFLLVFGFYASYHLFFRNGPAQQETLETENSLEPVYEIREEQGSLTVYTSDGTLYETTDISLESLPGEVTEQIRNGLFIRGKQNLYGFLENYSS